MTITIQTVPLSDSFVPSAEAMAELHSLQAASEEAAVDPAESVEASIGATDEEQAGQEMAFTETATAEEEPIDAEEFRKEIELLSAISEQIKKKREAEAVMESLKDKLKEAKDHYKLEVARCEKLEGELMDLLEGKAFPKKQESEENEGSEVDDDSLVDESDEGWREMPTGEVCEGISGLGAKKLEALIALAPTLGKLVDLQAQAYNGDFREQLPDGFGVKIAEKIENAIEAAVIVYQRRDQKSAAEQVKENQPTQEPTAEPEQVIPTAEPAEFVFDDSQCVFRKYEIEELLEDTRQEAIEEEWTLEECTYDENEESIHEESLAAYKKFHEKNSSVFDFPIDFDRHHIQRWLQGWVAAERRQKLLVDQMTL